HLSEFLILGGDEDDTNVPDSEQDIKPRFHRSKLHGFERIETNGEEAP
ncbi:19679_t:CDS:1, partial [Entrophospora sp. SA101]